MDIDSPRAGSAIPTDTGNGDPLATACDHHGCKGWSLCVIDRLTHDEKSLPSFNESTCAHYSSELTRTIANEINFRSHLFQDVSEAISSSHDQKSDENDDCSLPENLSYEDYLKYQKQEENKLRLVDPWNEHTYDDFVEKTQKSRKGINFIRLFLRAIGLKVTTKRQSDLKGSIHAEYSSLNRSIAELCLFSDKVHAYIDSKYNLCLIHQHRSYSGAIGKGQLCLKLLFHDCKSQDFRRLLCKALNVDFDPNRLNKVFNLVKFEMYRYDRNMRQRNDLFYFKREIIEIARLPLSVFVGECDDTCVLSGIYSVQSVGTQFGAAQNCNYYLANGLKSLLSYGHDARRSNSDASYMPFFYTIKHEFRFREHSNECLRTCRKMVSRYLSVFYPILTHVHYNMEQRDRLQLVASKLLTFLRILEPYLQQLQWVAHVRDGIMGWFKSRQEKEKVEIEENIVDGVFKPYLVGDLEKIIRYDIENAEKQTKVTRMQDFDVNISEDEFEHLFGIFLQTFPSMTELEDEYCRSDTFAAVCNAFFEKYGQPSQSQVNDFETPSIRTVGNISGVDTTDAKTKDIEVDVCLEQSSLNQKKFKERIFNYRFSQLPSFVNNIISLDINEFQLFSLLAKNNPWHELKQHGRKLGAEQCLMALAEIIEANVLKKLVVRRSSIIGGFEAWRWEKQYHTLDFVAKHTQQDIETNEATLYPNMQVLVWAMAIKTNDLDFITVNMPNLKVFDGMIFKTEIPAKRYQDRGQLVFPCSKESIIRFAQQCRQIVFLGMNDSEGLDSQILTELNTKNLVAINLNDTFWEESRDEMSYSQFLSFFDATKIQDMWINRRRFNFSEGAKDVDERLGFQDKQIHMS